ncbi:hypothetical protein M404DRAFT_955395, partial [Pisolithus tinctorius Marx 270]
MSEVPYTRVPTTPELEGLEILDLLSFWFKPLCIHQCDETVGLECSPKLHERALGDESPVHLGQHLFTFEATA